MKRKAFTLIELLVVIAIIALLMAILMPSLQKARHQARRIACAAHLKSCGYAGVLYSNDNEGSFRIATWRFRRGPAATPSG